MCSMSIRVGLSVCGAAVVPGEVPTWFDQVRAEERTNNYYYLLNRDCDWALPFATRGLPASALAHLAPERPVRIDVSPPGVSAGDLAIQAARRALAEAERGQPGTVRWLIYCPTTVDEDTGSSIVCRIAHELQLPQCFPIALSQSQVAGTFVALLLAESLLADADPQDRVLVVAADKWMFPFVRAHGPWGVASDGGAALVLGGADVPARISLSAVSVASAPESMWAPVDTLTLPGLDPGDVQAAAAAAIEASGVAPASVRRSLPAADAGVGPALARLVDALQREGADDAEAGTGLVVLQGIQGDVGACTVTIHPRPAAPLASAHETAEAAMETP